MKLNRLIPILLLLSGSVAHAEKPTGVPAQLFGIKIGGIYEISEDDPIGNLPFKKLAGIQSGLSVGVHYYFEPREANRHFEYIEERKKPDDNYFTTSFHMYLLPVIPNNVVSIDQLRKLKSQRYEVARIDWSSDSTSKDDGYYWAMNLCKTFEADLAIKPKVTDYRSENWYQCEFRASNRSFSVTSRPYRGVSLEMEESVVKKKSSLLERRLRKLAAKEIRPY